MLLIWLACTKADAPHTGETGEAPDPASVPLAGECPMETDFGGFLVLDDGDATSVDGGVADGVVPITILEEIGAEGDCRLMRRNNPHCSPDCDAGFTCDWDGVCVPYPSRQDLGRVTLDGLAQPVEMDPVFPGNTYFDTSLPHPAMLPGELLTLRAPDAGLRLYGVGVEPLEGLQPEWSVEAGVDLVVSWTAPASAVPRGEVFLSVNIDQHGVSPGTLVCVFDDDGEGVVPGGLVEQLVGVGVTGFPSGSLERRTLDSAPHGEGCVDLRAASRRSVAVDVVGFTPCTSDAECPDELDCNEELQVCQ